MPRENALLYRLSRTLPQSLRDKANIYVREAGLEEDGATWLANTIILSILFAIAGAGVLYFSHEFLNEWMTPLGIGFAFTRETSISVGAILGFLVGLAFLTLSLYYRIESRRKKVEDVLPDFLLLVAGNIRAGMTSFSAFKSSTRPEFGALSDEIRTVTTRALGTESFGNVLSGVSARIKSKSLSETVRFFLQAVRSGGKIAQILESTSADLRRTQDLKKELVSNTKTYVIFVGFVMVIATPLLMAVSVEFVSLITRIQTQNAFLTESAASTSAGFLGGKLSISPSFLESIAYVLLFGNALLAGIFMGVIGEGKPLLGLRYSPLLFIVSIIAFGVSRTVLAGMLST
ncbi:MAG: type II secretion system F family protein [Candidatus Diapherotrites archaeon]|uniref:Type II secretion system F family protein n=1 Tax=Candidatus Iainarchaeum sp. TaxID=3101447 RepID=A0A8T4C7I6_9ARCH|nr:type II secretion system F family protein [Candidatus Diapherotrites archaeon]